MISEEWVPIIVEGVQWVKESFGPSKKQLKMRITDLEEQVRSLSSGNQALLQNSREIMSVILEKLLMDGGYRIKANTIIQNSGNFQMTQIAYFDDNSTKNSNEKKQASIFDGIDEEIMKYRLLRQSEKE